MGMTALNLRLPDSLRARVEARAAESGFDSVEAYVHAVLLADSTGGAVLEDEELESLLLSRADGRFVEADEADFWQMRGRLTKRLESRQRRR
jgi:hypothetical protein